jgi:hypothetical protein
MFGEDDSCVDLLKKPGLPCFAVDNVCVSLHQGRVILIRGMHQVFFPLSFLLHLAVENVQHLKTKEVAFKDPNECRLFSTAGSSVPGYQSPFQSTSSSTHVKAVGGQNMVVLEGYQNPAMETSQHKPTEKTRGWNCGVEEIHSQELQPEDREIGKEQTREQERGSGTEEAEDVVARTDVDMEQVALRCGALESGFGSGCGVVHALVQQGSRQGQDVVQRNGTCNLLAHTPDNDRPGSRTSFRKWTCDPSMDVHSRPGILEELNTTPSQACNIQVLTTSIQRSQRDSHGFSVGCIQKYQGLMTPSSYSQHQECSQEGLD